MGAMVNIASIPINISNFGLFYKKRRSKGQFLIHFDVSFFYKEFRPPFPTWE